MAKEPSNILDRNVIKFYKSRFIRICQRSIGDKEKVTRGWLIAVDKVKTKLIICCTTKFYFNLTDSENTRGS
jgi:transcription elongation factor